MATRMLQTHFHVAYECRGEKLSPKRCNPLLEKFRMMLKDFRVERENFKAYVSVAGDTIIEVVDTRLLKVSTHLTFEVVDTSPSLDINLLALDDRSRGEIHQGLRKISLVDGKYSHRVDLQVMDSFEGSEPPMSHPGQSCWPKQRF